MIVETALASGVGLMMAALPSLILDATILRLACGKPRVFGEPRLGFNWLSGLALTGTLVANLVILWVVLRRWGAVEIREDLGPRFGLMFCGQILLLVCCSNFGWLGVSLREDAVERRNPAALSALLGGIGAVGLIWAGANVGEGPSYANNFFTAALGVVFFFAVWFVLEKTTRISDSISEDRNLASGARMGIFLFSVGLIFARAATGDWHSMVATVRDFVVDGSMAFFILAIAIMVEKSARCLGAILPAALYLALAAGWILHLGRWEGYR